MSTMTTADAVDVLEMLHDQGLGGPHGPEMCGRTLLFIDWVCDLNPEIGAFYRRMRSLRDEIASLKAELTEAHSYTLELEDERADLESAIAVRQASAGVHQVDTPVDAEQDERLRAERERIVTCLATRGNDAAPARGGRGRGRPPIYARAMTAAERARRSREQRKGAGAGNGSDHPQA
jgi:hypothetical protein